jgi:hypothetical protein
MTASSNPLESKEPSIKNATITTGKQTPSLVMNRSHEHLNQTWPLFEINNENTVLVKISSGKNYITQPYTHLTQASQKGGTCWYYTLNYLRPRYGKGIDLLIAFVNKHQELKTLIADKDFIFLQKHREIEKKVSEHRKHITILDHSPQKNTGEAYSLLARLFILKLQGSTYKDTCDQEIKAKEVFYPQKKF